LAHLRIGAAVRGLNREPRAPSRGAPGVSTPAAVLTRLGRMLLWLLVAVLLIRGASDVLAPRAPAVASRAVPAARPAWPDDEAGAFAVAFARAYLSYSPRDPERSARAVRAFVADDVVDAVVPQFGRRTRRQLVSAAMVARTAVVDARHALVTVAVDDGRYLTVPVARGDGGGLVVYDLPSLAAPPARGRVEPQLVDPLSGADQDEIRDVLTRFFRAFLAGDARELSYFVPAGVRMGALRRRHELVGDVSVMQAPGPARARRRDVVVTVRARDVASGAVFPLRYRLGLVRGERWLVTEVNEATHREG
jgi:hypothetical protein